MKILIFILSLIPVSSFAFNLVGGKYSNLNDAATARVRGATAAYLNPAGLAFEESSSISSGASAYNYYFSKQDNETSVTTKSSTSHVATIKSFNNYNFGFLLYTAANLSRNTGNSNYYTNSEGYLQGENSYTQTDVEQNIYILAISPKESNWGLSLNLFQTTASVTRRSSSQNYSKTNPEERYNKSATMNFDYQKYSASLSLGQQIQLSKNLQAGYKLSSPRYLITGGGNYKYDGVNSTGVDTNNSTLAQFHFDYKTEDKYSTVGESLVVGLSYLNQNWIYSLDISHVSGYLSEKTIAKDSKSKNTVWVSSLDYYNETQANSFFEGNGSTHNSITVNNSIEFYLEEDQTMGFGFSYTPTPEKNGSGVDVLQIASGYSHKYKNFLGSYGLSYIKGMDTGKNTYWNEAEQKEVKTIEEYEIISFMLSGAYYF